MSRCQDGVEIKSIIHIVLVRDMLQYVQDVRAVRGMVHNRSVWRGFVRENFVGDEPLTLTRCHSNMKPL